MFEGMAIFLTIIHFESKVFSRINDLKSSMLAFIYDLNIKQGPYIRYIMFLVEPGKLRKN